MSQLDDTLKNAIDPTDALPLLAGTLTLMSCFTHHQCPSIAAKVAHNLRCLAQHEALSDAFCGLCVRLQAHWQHELNRSPHLQRRADQPQAATENSAPGLLH